MELNVRPKEEEERKDTDWKRKLNLKFPLNQFLNLPDKKRSQDQSQEANASKNHKLQYNGKTSKKKENLISLKNPNQAKTSMDNNRVIRPKTLTRRILNLNSNKTKIQSNKSTLKQLTSI